MAENGSNESSKLLLNVGVLELCVSNALHASSLEETTLETAPQGSVVLFSFLGVVLFFSLRGNVPPNASSTDAVNGSWSFLKGSPPVKITILDKFRQIKHNFKISLHL